MDSILASARAHIAKIEDRSTQQREHIEELKRSGRDASEAARTLVMLQRALQEMHLQIAHLIGDDRERKRAAPKAKPAAKK
jgi:hypothetical protein